MITAEQYEQFMRTALACGRNRENGADADEFRQLVSSYAAMPEKGSEIDEVIRGNEEGSSELHRYNATALRVAGFVKNAFNQIQNNIELSPEHKDEFRSIKVKGTLDSINEAVAVGISLLEIRTQVEIEANETLKSFGIRARNILQKKIYCFRGLEKIKVSLEFTPKLTGDLEQGNFTFSEDKKELFLRGFVHAFYDTEGRVVSYDRDFEFESYFEMLISSAIDAFRD